MKTRPGFYSEQIRNEALMNIIEKLSKREAQVYQCILEFGPITTEKIAEILGGHPNWYTGRIKTLRDDMQLIEFAGTSISEISNAKASLWKVKKWDPQLALQFS